MNPWDVKELADGIRYALSMTPLEKLEHHSYATKHVRMHTSQHWAQTFITSLLDTEGKG